MSSDPGRYVVLKQLGPEEWRVLGEVGATAWSSGAPFSRPGNTNVLGREPESDEKFAVLPRSEWRLSLDY